MNWAENPNQLKFHEAIARDFRGIVEFVERVSFVAFHHLVAAAKEQEFRANFRFYFVACFAIFYDFL